MRCNCLCCIMSRDAMRCHVMCAHVKSCHLLCPALGMECYELKTNLFSTQLLCTAKILLQCYSSTTLYYKGLLRTTKYYYSRSSTFSSSTALYYKVLLQYYSVQRSLFQYSAPVRVCYKVLVCTTKSNSFFAVRCLRAMKVAGEAFQSAE